MLALALLFPEINFQACRGVCHWRSGPLCHPPNAASQPKVIAVTSSHTSLQLLQGATHCFHIKKKWRKSPALQAARNHSFGGCKGVQAPLSATIGAVLHCSEGQPPPLPFFKSGGSSRPSEQHRIGVGGCHGLPPAMALRSTCTSWPPLQ